MMKKSLRLMAVALLATIGLTSAHAQGSLTVDQLARASRQQQQAKGGQQKTNPYSRSSYQSKSNTNKAFGTFFVEYNPVQIVYDSKFVDNDNITGVSLGFSYFTPIAEGLGFDAGLKGQYFFDSEKAGGVEYKQSMFSVTVPVDLAYKLDVADGFSVIPYAGLYARFNCVASFKEDYGGGKRYSVNPFSKDDVGDDTWNRFQFGFQAGLNFQISESVSLGGAYFMDLNELADKTKMRGFNVSLGVIF